VICRTLGELHDPSSREPLMKAIGDPEGLVRSEACRALGKVGQPEDATVLARVMMVDSLEDCRIAAIEGLGTLKAKDPRIMQILVTAMEHDDPAMRLASLKALRNITGLDRGVDPAAWRDAVLPQVAAKPAADSPAAAAAAAAIERK
jgi:HEAT repeat protein